MGESVNTGNQSRKVLPINHFPICRPFCGCHLKGGRGEKDFENEDESLRGQTLSMKKKFSFLKVRLNSRGGKQETKEVMRGGI